MKRVIISLTGLAICILTAASLLAQPATCRTEDQFYKRTVTNRIDLNEKINLPLVRYFDRYHAQQAPGSTHGVVAGLLEGLQNRAYTAYDPDDLSRPMSYDEVQRRMQRFDQGGIDLFFESEEDDLFFPEDEPTVTQLLDAADSLFAQQGFANSVLSDLAPYEAVLQFVEDRYVDKNRGEMVSRIRYLQVIWSDPGEVLPEKILAVFRYEEVAETLDQVYCFNRHNEAGMLTALEIFEKRIFHSYITNISNMGIHDLPESERRRRQLVEYEHHLWSY
ncbi:MAG: hypothetical protein D6722_27115 [Bacteroidetes bacterium]|nr:MAG: hypothetical protein D6722_27115 [Bacteroidota bacterium]